MKKKFVILLTLVAFSGNIFAQERTAENRPYTDLRPFHLGIVIGTHNQDLEFANVGPQLITNEDGTQANKLITCDQDRWDMGFNVGVLGELRLTNEFSFRVSPQLYFGTRHITFHNFTDALEDGTPIEESQTMKSVYVSSALDLIYNSQRLNNIRPYLMVGLNPMLNLTNKSSDYIRLKRHEIFFELGLGCDLYLPFFKLRPELKFCYGLLDSFDDKHADELKDKNMVAYAKSVKSAHSKMIVLSFYFD